MRKVTLCATLLAVLAVGFVAGSWTMWRTSSHAATPAGRKVLYWVDPMHPSYKSDKPGIAPDCGMQLEPVYADDLPPQPGAAMPANALKVTAERQQLIGVQVVQAQSEPGRRTIRTVGRVTPDENRIYRVLAATDGIVRRLFPVSTGALVAPDQMLLDYYVREALGAQQSFFYALTTLDRLKAAGGDLTQQSNLVNAQVRQAVEALRGLGMDDIQISRIAKTRTPVAEIEVRSPVAGYVLARNVSPRQRFERGTELYRIVDLTRVWIEASIFESDAPLVHAGTEARFSAAYGAGGALTTRVSQVLPQFDTTTRTLKIRLETENPNFVLRPDMFVDVEMVVDLPRAVTVPAEAVVDFGSRKVVFVDRGSGYFEPRRVETGTRFEDRVQIIRGLREGERVVVSGNFLLSSETRLKMTAMGISSPESDPVCGMDVDRMKASAAGKMSSYAGQTFYFCSDDCKKKFEADPRKYAGDAVRPPLPAATPVRMNARHDGEGAHGRTQDVLQELGIEPVDAPLATASIFEVDPVCGAEVDKTDRNVLKSVFAGKTYYFMMKECKDEFDKDPAKYANAASAAANGREHQEAARKTMPPGAEVARAANQAAHPATTAVTGSVADPVCGMSVEAGQARSAKLTSDYQGRTYYFCSDDCKKKFDKEPARYAAK